MASLNSFDFTGRLGRDPELRQAGSHDVCGFSVAVDAYGDRPTLWVDVSVWGSAAGPCAKYLAKGREVAVHGSIDEIATFERRDGTAGTSLRVSTRDVTFIGGRGDEGPSANGVARSDVPSDSDFTPVAATAPADDQDIPF
jgi:single-strand DNA-binding protein